MIRFGYARVSGRRQDLGTQLEILTRGGCDYLFSEVASGSDRSRPVLRQVVSEAVGASGLGSVEVVVTRMDRWSRDVIAGRAAIEELSASGVRLLSLSECFDSLQPSGLYMATVLMASAELERSSRRDQILEHRRVLGPGANGGRPRSLTPGQVGRAASLKRAGLTSQEIADHLGVSRSTLFRSLRRTQPQP